MNQTEDSVYDVSSPERSTNETLNSSCFPSIPSPFQLCIAPSRQNQNLLVSPSSSSPSSKYSSNQVSIPPPDDETIGDGAHDSEVIVAPTSSMVSETNPRTSSMRSAALQIRSLAFNQEQRWESIEDELLIFLNGEVENLQYVQALHDQGLESFAILQSVAFLGSRMNQNRNQSAYYEHVAQIACFFAISRAKRQQKLGVLKAIMSCLSMEKNSWQAEDPIIERTLDFLTADERTEWEYPEHTESCLIWELRAMSRRLLELPRERAEYLARTGDTAAIMIAVGAKLFEEGMNRSVPVISNQIEKTATRVKENLKPDDYPLIMDRDAVVALTFADAAKRASESAKEGTRKAVRGIYDASSTGIRLLTDKFDGSSMNDNLPPESREALKAAGKVGMATVGAAAIIGEALLETSRAVLQHTASAAADVVEHKYGSSAGQVAADAGETVVNVYRTMGHVSLMSESKVLAKALARESGKEQVHQEVEKAKETLKAFENKASALLLSTNLFVGSLGMSSTALPSKKEVTDSLAVSSQKKSVLNERREEKASSPTSSALSSKGSGALSISDCSSTEIESDSGGSGLVGEGHGLEGTDSVELNEENRDSSSVVSSKSTIARRSKHHSLSRSIRRGSKNRNVKTHRRGVLKPT